MSVCLQCGKQLAFLKTLAGPIQFCSDEHRQRYQDDSNKLAVDRLMRTKAAKKDKKQAAARPGQVKPGASAPVPPEMPFLMENPGGTIALHRRPIGATTPILRGTSTLFPRVPSLESSIAFSTTPPALLRHDLQDAGIGLGGSGGGGDSQSGSASIFVAPNQILKAQRPLPHAQFSDQAASSVLEYGARSEQTVSEFNQDQKSQNRFRLAPREQAGPKFPMAGPMDGRDFLHLAGDVPLEPYSLDVVHFPVALSLSELSLSTLTTTGFEGLDELIAEHSPAPVEAVAEPEPEPEPAPVIAPAPPRTTLLPITCKPAAPGHAKIIQGYPALPIHASAAGGDPVFDERPLRPRMVLGPHPNAAKPVVEAPPAAKLTTKPNAGPVAAAAPAPTPVRTTPIVPKPVPTSPVVSAPIVTKAPQAVPPVVKPAVQPAAAAPAPPAAKPAPAAPPPPAPRLVPQPSVTIKAPAPPTVTVRPPAAAPPAAPQRPAAAASVAAPPPAVVAPAEKPAAPATTVSEPVTKPAAAASPASAPAPAPAPEKPKISVRPASTPSVAPAPSIDRDKRPTQRPTPSSPSRPAMAARDGNALTADRPEPEAAPAPATQLKPKLVPARKSEPAFTSTVAVEEFTIGMHQMEPSAFGKFWGSASTPVKAAAMAAALAIVVTAGYFIFRPSQPAESAYVPGPTAISEGNSPGGVIGGGGWTTNWGSDAPVNKGKQISLFRPSMSMTDYRFEFRGQIEKKAMGWIFRAANSKTYHVEKIEIIKPGANPIVALIKYSVIKGVEGTHTQVMLPSDFKMDTAYRVRMDVKGNKFTTYVQDKLVDYWTDDQIKTGGAGFYTAQGERAQIRTSQIAYLGAN